MKNLISYLQSFIENLNDIIPSDKKSRFVYIEPKAVPAKSKLLKNFIL